jgi:microsomal dipeptidase-like Zn-dependent dipeptidase
MDLFFDAHCHPTLKRYLFGYNFFRPGRPRKDNDYTNIVVTLPALERGNVNAIIAFHHLPEKQIIDDWKTVDVLHPLLKVFAHRYLLKVERKDAFGQTIDMITEFEDHVRSGEGCKIAYSYVELINILNSGEKAILQGLEGGHHLGRDLSLADYEAHLGVMRAKGIAVITLSHFYPNDITSPIEGIPPKTKRELGMHYVPDPNVELTEKGKQIVEAIWNNGILIDLTHTCPRQRAQIFELNQNRIGGMRPLLFTHTGVRAMFGDHNHPEFGLMSPDDNEINSIKICNGLIGIIFMNYWLTGNGEKFISGRDNAYESILKAIKHIRNVTGSFDHVAIGSDFDGMTDPSDDCFEPGMFANFKEKLLRDKERIGATAEDILKITGGNLLRVLEQGWVG